MPRIPISNRETTIEAGVPGVDVPLGTAGLQYAALAKLGSNVADFGVKLQEARTKAETNDFLSQTKAKDVLGTEQFRQQDLLNNGPDGHLARVQEHVNSIFDANQRNAPSEFARQAYTTDARSYLNTQLVGADQTANNEKVKIWAGNLNQLTDSTSSAFISDPDPTKWKQRTDIYRQAIDNSVGNINNQQQADILKAKGDSQAANNLFQGMYIAKNLDGQALKMLQTPNEISAALTPGEKAEWLTRFQNKVLSVNSGNVEQANKILADVKAKALSGYGFDEGSASKGISLILQSKMKPDDRARMLSEYTTIKQAADATASFHNMTSDQLMKYQPEMNTNTFNIANRIQINDKLKSIRDSVLRIREADPAAYVSDPSVDPQIASLSVQAKSRNPQDTQNYLAAVDNKFKTLGINNGNLLSKEDTALRADEMNAAIKLGPDAAAKAVDSLYTEYGPFAPQVFSQVAKKGGIPKEMGIAGYFPDRQTRQDIVFNAVNKPAIEKNFRSSPISDKMLNSQVSAKLDDVFHGALEDNPTFAQSMMDQATLMVKAKLFKTGSVGSGALDQAIQDTKQRLLDDNFFHIKSGNSDVLIQKQSQGIQVNDKAVQSFMELYNTKEGFQQLGVSPEYEGLKTPQQKDSFFNSLDAYGKWTVNKDGGLTLKVPDAVTGKLRPVHDASGKEINKSIQEINATPVNPNLGFGTRNFLGRILQ